ncbi:multidrug effflux MFS transporter [Marinifilum caeruleilacunae]|uniref:Bcr/CflA family efflux MFS transporter n=1 Tax=Marinifilum caeruleilacunae TaxID=2499076 RepID=A0ABX1WTX2_9BACT|nr:multidrug effflux MFS transporter [Marinifilum caeruleilacunae]NOU59522.1 Bcr/CflA family efflux MFS transporter [Marinifilum caeruleilacunae]
MQIQKKSDIEFIIIMASLMSLASLSIDALLPGLPEIAKTIGISDPKNNQLLVTIIFLGMGFGQLISGPLSDSIGRKNTIYLGFSLFTFSSLLCIYSTSMEMMIIGRFIQGIGLSAPRTVATAMVRDRFVGDYMAKIMSFVTVIFILAPIIAPSFGKLMLSNFGWESIFSSQLLFGLFVIIWLWQRQPETLSPDKRKQMSLSLFTNGIKEFAKHPQSLTFTFMSGLILSAFMVYLSSSQQIFQEQYGLVEEFPFIFSGIAIVIGLSTFLNGSLVVKFGMLKLATNFTILLCCISLTYVILFFGEPNPNFGILLLFFVLMLFCIGFIFGNINALAMQPMGHIAGIGAALFGFIGTVLAVPIATFIGRFIDTTALPLFAGFAICSGTSLLLIYYYKLVLKKASLKQSTS